MNRYEEFIHSIKESRENKWFKYSERHHIIPRCLGGTEDEENLIYLTYREHFIAHKLLAEENPSESKLAQAYWFMCHSKHNELVTPEEYEDARIRFINSKLGSKHSEEAKSKIAESSRGRIPSAETRKKISLAKLNHKVSAETRKKLALAASNISDSTRLKKSISAKNRKPFSEETRRKMSDNMRGNKLRLGKKFTPEQLETISTNRKGIKGIEYHLTCKKCSSEFISSGPRGKYCKKCKEESNEKY